MNRSKSLDKIIVLVVITILFYVGILIYSDINSVVDKVLKIKYEFLPIILSLMGIQFICLGIKYHRLLQKLSIRIPVFDSIKIFISGLSLIATPGGAGTAIKSHILKKKLGHPLSLTLPIIFVERLTELLAILIVLTIFLMWTNLYESLIAIGLGYIFVSIMFIISSNNQIFKSVKSFFMKIKRIRKFSQTLDDSKNSLSQLMKPKSFTEAMGWSLIAKTCQFVAVYFVFLSLDINIGIILSGQIYYTSLVLGALTFIPSGLIVTESSMLALLINNGIGLSISTLAVILTRIITTWLGTILGIIALKSIGISSNKLQNNTKSS
jgi:uncharacterized protein (TIRG00374 family)